MYRPVISYKVRFIGCAIHVQGNYWELNIDNIVMPFFIADLDKRREKYLVQYLLGTKNYFKY